MARRWAALAILCCACGAGAQGIETPRFDIRRFVVEGATLVPAAALDAATAPYAGPARDFGHVQRALEAVQARYTAAGYRAVQVLLPEQDLARGEVRLRVVEARIERVQIEGNRHFDAANVRASLPALAPGTAPEVRALARSLRLANENPAKRATLLLRPADADGVLEARVRVADEPAARAQLTLDNSGTRVPGRARLGADYRHANLFGGDEVLRLHASGGEQARITGAGLRLPFYGAGGALELVGGEANVDAGRAGELFEVTGAGTLFAARYAHALAAGRLALGWELRAYDGPPRTTVRPVSLAYEGSLRHERGETELAAGAWRHAAAPAYTLWRWSLQHRRPLGAWQLRFALAGQHAREALVAGERFGLGGADALRGFEARAATGDRGHRGALQLEAPLPGTPVQALAFYDWGALRNLQPAPGAPAELGLAAAGFGLRGALGARLRWRIDWARVLDAGGAGLAEQRVHASLSYATLLP